MTYRPSPESLAGQVLGFFALNPDEELTLEDIVLKFVHPGDNRNVHTQLMAACDHDMLVYCPEEESYKKGRVALTTNDLTPQPAPAAPATKRAPAKAKKMPSSKPRIDTLDLNKIAIEDNVPIPTQGPDWKGFLSRFSVGQSAQLPANVLLRLRAGIKEAKAAGIGTFLTRRMSEDHIRVWRTE